MNVVTKIETSKDTYNVSDAPARASIKALRNKVTKLATDVQGIESLLNVALKELGVQPVVIDNDLETPNVDLSYKDSDEIDMSVSGGVNG